MISIPNALADGLNVVDGGMDANTPATRIEDNQVAFSINTSFRTGYCAQRPGYDKIALTFAQGTSQSDFENGLFQEANYFHTEAGERLIMALIGGKVYRILISGKAGTVENLPLAVDNNPNLPMGWSVQADKYFILQDGSSLPIIYDGITIRRANTSTATTDNIPVGKAMAYGNGRLIVTNDNYFTIGDILGGPTNVITFTETNVYNEGGYLTVPTEFGKINACAFLAQQDTQTGQGNLLVFAELGGVSLNTLLDRSTWKDYTGFQKVALIGAGSISQRALTPVNGDIYFRSSDGMRSYVDVVLKFARYAARTPISSEVLPVLEKDSYPLLPYIPCVYFDNRLIFGCSPQPNAAAAYCRGLISLCYEGTTSLRKAPKVAYDGLWTGLNPMQFVKGYIDNVERCFMFCYQSNKNEIWELTRKEPFDRSNCGIESSIVTKAFDYGKPANKKRLLRVDTWWADIQGAVDVTIEYRPDYDVLWYPLTTFSLCAANETCVVNDCSAPANYLSQFRSQVKSNTPDIATVSSEGKPCAIAFMHQLRITWKGHATLKQVVAIAKERTEATNAEFQGSITGEVE